MHDTMLDIVSLNIELDRHFDRVIPFLQKRQPDVVLLQEVLDKDLAYLEKAIGMKSVFTVLKILCRPQDESKLGIAIFSRLPILRHYNAYYRGNSLNIPRTQEGEPEKITRAILWVELRKGEKDYCLVNTHFTWSPDGQASPQQYEDLNSLFRLLAEIPEFVLCGDFNAPRGRAIFEAIASRYQDNIPSHITTSIDKNLHKAGDLNLMVDGLFTTPAYQANSVEVHNNLSDHCAIVAQIKKI